MSPIKNVAVAGATGILGPDVVKALLDSGFTVTTITRTDSTSTHLPGVKVQKADYSSTESLAKALKGQDAVVSVLGSSGIGLQPKLIDAAVQAGVKRFIPSEFGVDTTKVTGGIAKILGGKVAAREHLKKAAADNSNFSWTGIATGLFFDWGLKAGSLGFSIPNQTVSIYDSGNEPIASSNLSFIGRAVAAVLQHPEETANKYITVASLITTQNSILAAFEAETGTKWKVTKQDTADSLKIADEKLAKGDFSAFSDYLKPTMFKDGHGAGAKEPELSNKLLGLQQEDLRTIVKAALAA